MLQFNNQTLNFIKHKIHLFSYYFVFINSDFNANQLILINVYVHCFFSSSRCFSSINRHLLHRNRILYIQHNKLSHNPPQSTKWCWQKCCCYSCRRWYRHCHCCWCWCWWWCWCWCWWYCFWHTSYYTQQNLTDNPLHCSCDAQKLWEWLRDHRKWSTSDRINYLRCEHPAELRGKVFAKMEPQQFCDAPLIPKIAIQDIQPYSVVVSWQSREHLGLNGYEIVYHAMDGIDADEVS